MAQEILGLADRHQKVQASPQKEIIVKDALQKLVFAVRQLDFSYAKVQNQPTLFLLDRALAEADAAIAEAAIEFANVTPQETELANLRAWKAEATTVFNHLNIQAVGRELEVPLGVDVAHVVLPEVKKLKARLVEAHKVIRILEGQ